MKKISQRPSNKGLKQPAKKESTAFYDSLKGILFIIICVFLYKAYFYVKENIGTFILISLFICIIIFYKIKEKNRKSNHLAVIPEKSYLKFGNKDYEVFVPKTESTYEDDILTSSIEDTVVEINAYIEYQDRVGTVSKRIIRTRTIAPWNDGDYSILAFCKVKQGNRTFVTSRIMKMFDLDNNMAVTDVPRYFYELHASLPHIVAKRNMGKYENDFIILVFILKCDGRIQREEYGIIKSYFEGNLMNFNEMSFRKLIIETSPSINDFQNAIKALKNMRNKNISEFLKIIHEIRKLDHDDQFTTDTIKQVVKKLNV